jgi:hypothetical protein
VQHDGYVQGDLLTVEAWEVERYCDACDPVVWHALDGVLLLPNGVVKVLAQPGADVVFVVGVVGQ